MAELIYVAHIFIHLIVGINRQILQLAFNSDVYPFHSVQIVEASYDRGLSVWCKSRPFPCLCPCSYPPASNNPCSFRPCNFSRANIKHAKTNGSVRHSLRPTINLRAAHSRRFRYTRCPSFEKKNH